MDSITAYLKSFEEGLRVGNISNQRNIDEDDINWVFQVGLSIGIKMTVDTNMKKLKIGFVNGFMIVSNRDMGYMPSSFEAGVNLGFNNRKLCDENKSLNVEKPKNKNFYVWTNIQSLRRGIITVMATNKKEALELISQNFTPETYQEVSKIEPEQTNDKGYSWASGVASMGCDF